MSLQYKTKSKTTRTTKVNEAGTWDESYYLTRGGLTDVRKRSMKHGWNKIYREKSAEAIVPHNDHLGRAEP